MEGNRDELKSGLSPKMDEDPKGEVEVVVEVERVEGPVLNRDEVPNKEEPPKRLLVPKILLNESVEPVSAFFISATLASTLALWLVIEK